jgi:hypothetical protein
MKQYVRYDSSGEIIGQGVCQDCDLELQGENVIEGFANPNTCCVINGEIVAYTDEQIALKANRPDYAISWDNASMAWVFPDASIVLEKQKAAKWIKTKQDRLTDVYSPLTFSGSVFDADKDSQQLIAGAVQIASLAPNDWVIDWTLSDNSTKTMTKAEIIGLGLALGERTAAAWSKSRLLRTQIEAATSESEINSINYSA